MDIVKALEMLKNLELKMEKLYARYHRLFSADTNASAVFLVLQAEERSHADLIDYQIRMARRNRALFRDVEFDAGTLNNLIAGIEGATNSAQLAAESAAEPVSLEHALALSIEFENNACEYHYRTLIVESNPEIEPLIRNLGSSDKMHAETLGTLSQKVKLPA